MPGSGRTSIGFLTDSATQFPIPGAGSSVLEHLLVVPHHIHLDGERLLDSKELRPNVQWFNNRNGSHPRLEAPSVDEFRQAYSLLGQRYATLVALLTSSHLSQAYANALKAAETFKGPAVVQVIDSQTIGTGVGMLINAIAEAASKGASPIRINRLARGLIPHIYTTLCLQSLNTLAHNQLLDPAQAAIGEMLGMIPFYILDNGKLVPIQKARSPRQIVDLMDEFVSEFEHLSHIAVLHGLPPHEQEVRSLRERLNQNFAGVTISEQITNASLATLFGPRTLGIIATEDYPLEDLD